jgi:hypothetical protein
LGSSVRAAVSAARLAAGLDDALGCARADYRLDAAVSAPDSLWGFYLSTVAPATITREPNAWFVSSSGALRYDLYGGRVNRGDVLTILPFEDELSVIRGIGASALEKVLETLNEQALQKNETLHETRRPRFHSSAALPPYVATALAAGVGDAIFGAFDAPAVVAAIRRITGHDAVAMPFFASVDAAQYTDSQAWMDWASQLPQPPCAGSRNLKK